MRWSWLLDAWRILINPIRSWSSWSRRILNPLIFRNKFSLNMNWIICILLLKRKLLHLNLLLPLQAVIFSNSVEFSWTNISSWKIRQNPNNTWTEPLLRSFATNWFLGKGSNMMVLGWTHISLDSYPFNFLEPKSSYLYVKLKFLAQCLSLN